MWSMGCYLNRQHPFTRATLRTNEPAPAASRQLLLFLASSVLVDNPKKLLYTVTNPARGLLNRENRTKRESLAAHPPPPPQASRMEEIK